MHDPPPGVVIGSAEEMAEPILALQDFAIDEVRIDIFADPPLLAEATRAMSEVVDLVHRA
jgi:hypothetical protein